MSFSHTPVLALAAVGCGATEIERVELGMPCGHDADDEIEATIDGVTRCARATLTAPAHRADDSHDVVIPGTFRIFVEGKFGGDGNDYYLAIGLEPQHRSVRSTPIVATIDGKQVRRGFTEEPDREVAAAASFHIRRPLELYSFESIITKDGSVRFERYDLTTGRSRGEFELTFEATDRFETKRPIRVVGRFETSSPIDWTEYPR